MKKLFNNLACQPKFYRTNGDWVKSMSNQELAEFHKNNGCPPGSCIETCMEFELCVKCWESWFGQRFKEVL